MSENIEQQPEVEEGDEYSKQYSIQELMAHSLKVDQNVAEEIHADEKASAIETYGLVDPSTKAKSSKAKADAVAGQTVPVPQVPSNPFAAG